MKALLLSLMLVPSAAFAGHSDHHIFFCVVNGFDQKSVKGNCDPSKPNKSMTIPREWIAEDQVLKVNKPVKFALSHSQFEKWMAMNQTAKKGK